MSVDGLHRAVLLLDQPDSKNISSTCDFLISQALRLDRALLHATQDWSRTSVEWFIDDKSVLGSPAKTRLIYVANSPGMLPFRSLLARFGAGYMTEGCLYGGFSRGTLFHEQKTFGYNIFMSNDGRSDFWIRLYTWKIDEPSSI